MVINHSSGADEAEQLGAGGNGRRLRQMLGVFAEFER
jgi:hypothetical protein